MELPKAKGRPVGRPLRTHSVHLKYRAGQEAYQRGFGRPSWTLSLAGPRSIGQYASESGEGHATPGCYSEDLLPVGQDLVQRGPEVRRLSGRLLAHLRDVLLPRLPDLFAELRA